MKTQRIHQEVLISTRSKFAHKALVEISEKNEKESSVEKLVEAIWNGVLHEMFAELMPSASAKQPNIFTWGVYAGTSSLLVDLGDAPGVTEPALSIDPYLMSAEMCKN